MDTVRLPFVLVVHPILRVAEDYAEELSMYGFRCIASDVLAADYDAITALVLCGSLQWWIGLDDEQPMPPTVLVGGDSLGLVRAAGVVKCPEAASAELVARSLRSLIGLSRHTRGRGTMPMRVSSLCVAKVGRWMVVPRAYAYEEEHEITQTDLRPTVQ